MSARKKEDPIGIIIGRFIAMVLVLAVVVLLGVAFVKTLMWLLAL